MLGTSQEPIVLFFELTDRCTWQFSFAALVWTHNLSCELRNTNLQLLLSPVKTNKATVETVLGLV